MADSKAHQVPEQQTEDRQDSYLAFCLDLTYLLCSQASDCCACPPTPPTQLAHACPATPASRRTT